MLARHTFDFSRRLGSVLADGPEGKAVDREGRTGRRCCRCARRCARRRGRCRWGAAERDAALARVRTLAEQGLRAVIIASKPWSGATHEPEAADETALRIRGDLRLRRPAEGQLHGRHRPPGGGGYPGQDPVRRRSRGREAAGRTGRPAFRDRPVGIGHRPAERRCARRSRCSSVDAYGRLAPDQKSRLIKALQSRGEVVGFLGDGINDAPAVKVADIGLLGRRRAPVRRPGSGRHDPARTRSRGRGRWRGGGRRTFANILKYVRMGASSNFGNMLSMAAASLFLPFLPMLPTQILLNNLLYRLLRA